MLGIARALDRLLWLCAMIGAWMGLALVIVVCYDVTTRYLGLPKPAGLNSTMIQEFEYWLHSGLLALAIGYGYSKQAHVRIDLLRDTFSRRTKLWIETLGIAITLIPYSVLGVWMAWPYVVQSYTTGEISKSQTGLGSIWIVKAGLIALFLLLLVAGISQLLKCIAALRGEWPEDRDSEILGGGH